MKFNREQWNKERLEVEAQIRSLKTSIRRGGTRTTTVWDMEKRAYVEKTFDFGPGLGTYRDYSILEAFKSTATSLYEYRAAWRGKQHLPEGTMKREDIPARFLIAVVVPGVAEADLGVG